MDLEVHRVRIGRCGRLIKPLTVGRGWFVGLSVVICIFIPRRTFRQFDLPCGGLQVGFVDQSVGVHFSWAVGLLIWFESSGGWSAQKIVGWLGSWLVDWFVGWLIC